MSEQLQIPLDALRLHAASVDGVAEAVGTSRAAAEQTYLDREAYGLMCQFMPEYFEPGMRDTVDGLAGSSNELHALAAGLRKAADTDASANTEATNRLSTDPSVQLPL